MNSTNFFVAPKYWCQQCRYSFHKLMVSLLLKNRLKIR